VPNDEPHRKSSTDAAIDPVTLADLRARVAELERRIVTLEARELRDSDDRELVRAIAKESRGQALTAAAIVERARLTAPELAMALEAAGITGAIELGAWLRDMRGVVIGDVQLIRGVRLSDGYTWRVVHVV
jgi:hypothetical protein